MNTIDIAGNIIGELTELDMELNHIQNLIEDVIHGEPSKGDLEDIIDELVSQSGTIDTIIKEAREKLEA